jgi:AraC-like DNA-binding protein
MMDEATDQARRSLAQRSGIGASALVVQHGSLRFSRIVNDMPALILVRHGTKTLRGMGGDAWTVGAGDAIAIAAGQTFDVDNRLSAAGAYEAQWLVWDPAIIARYSHVPGGESALEGAAPLGRVETHFEAAFARARAGVEDAAGVPVPVAEHRMAEVLVWLALRGVHFAPQQTPALAARVRGMLQGALGEPWTIAGAASRMAMSEATFRRRLAEEGCSFGALLADARMSFAMVLLQSTDYPVNRIALDVGYESASRFAIRFRARFGFPPTAIRGHHRTLATPAAATPVASR